MEIDWHLTAPIKALDYPAAVQPMRKADGATCPACDDLGEYCRDPHCPHGAARLVAS